MGFQKICPGKKSKWDFSQVTHFSGPNEYDYSDKAARKPVKTVAKTGHMDSKIIPPPPLPLSSFSTNGTS